MEYRLIWEDGGIWHTIPFASPIPRRPLQAMRDGLRAAGYEARIQVEREWADVDE